MLGGKRTPGRQLVPLRISSRGPIHRANESSPKNSVYVPSFQARRMFAELPLTCSLGPP